MANEWLNHVPIGSIILVKSGQYGPMPVVLRGFSPAPHLPLGVTDKERNIVVSNFFADTHERYFIPMEAAIEGDAPDGSVAVLGGAEVSWIGVVDGLHDWSWLDGHRYGSPIWYNTGVGRMRMLYRGAHGEKMHRIENPQTAVWYLVHRVYLTPKDNPLPVKEDTPASVELNDRRAQATAAAEVGAREVDTEPVPVSPLAKDPFRVDEAKVAAEKAEESESESESESEITSLKAVLLTTERLVSEYLELDDEVTPAPAHLRRAVEIMMQTLRSITDEG